MDRALAAAAYMSTPKVRPTANYPLELHYIRALLIQQNYRQCIHACRDVLRVAGGGSANKPLQKTFVLFYLALAHDELARVMHPNSQTKLPAFNSAEHYFLEAVRALPSIEEARIHYAQAFQRDEDLMASLVTNKSLSNATSLSGYQSWDMDSDTESFHSLPSEGAVSQHRLSAGSLDSHDVETTDLEELESHSSFHEILSTSKDQSLKRDFSRISLLEAPAVTHTRPQPHGLMRPVRLGSPPQPYHPPRFHSRPATLDTSLRPSPTVKRAHTDTSLLQIPNTPPAEPGSPVSPLDPEDHLSDASTISPVSPTTPPHSSPLPSPLVPSTTSCHDLLDARLDAHLSAIRIQLETHIALVQQAKQQLFRARANRISVAQTPRSSLASSYSAATASSGGSAATATPSGIQQLRSFWSFTPEAVQREQKRQRVEEGRERNWTRPRFQAERYRDLAERALAEL